MSRNPKTGGKPTPKPRNIQELVDTLNESELHVLNQFIVERLRILQQQRAQQDMTQFRLGDLVRFTNNDGQDVTGVLSQHCGERCDLKSRNSYQQNQGIRL